MEQTVYSFNNLKGGDVFLVSWNGDNGSALNVVIPLKDGNFILAELNNKDYWFKYETFLNETQTLEEVKEYYETLFYSDDASMNFIGNVFDSKDERKIQLSLNSVANKLKNSGISDCKYLLSFIGSVQKYYEAFIDICDLTINIGDEISTYTSTDELLNKEVVSRIDSDYLLVPSMWDVKLNLDEEKMNRDELNEYLYELVAFERLKMILFNNSYTKMDTPIYQIVLNDDSYQSIN